MRLLDEATRRQLKYVQVGDGPIDLDCMPSFLLIGPQRTGTTWLHENLERHPEIFMPKEKELYYFNTLKFPQHHPAHLPPVSPDFDWYLDHFRPSAEVRAQRDKECRAEFGVPFTPRLYGESTATYAVELHWHKDVLAELLLLQPALRVVIIVRDPVERAWSHAKKDLAKLAKRKVRDVPIEEWIAFFRRPYQVQCGQFTTLVDSWRKSLGQERVFVGRFKDLEARPRQFLMDVYKFLGLPADERFIGSEAESVINPSLGDRLQPELRQALEELFAEEAARCRARGWI